MAVSTYGTTFKYGATSADKFHQFSVATEVLYTINYTRHTLSWQGGKFIN